MHLLLPLPAAPHFAPSLLETSTGSHDLWTGRIIQQVPSHACRTQTWSQILRDPILCRIPISLKGTSSKSLLRSLPLCVLPVAEVWKRKKATGLSRTSGSLWPASAVIQPHMEQRGHSDILMRLSSPAIRCLPALADAETLDVVWHLQAMARCARTSSHRCCKNLCSQDPHCASIHSSSCSCRDFPSWSIPQELCQNEQRALEALFADRPVYLHATWSVSCGWRAIDTSVVGRCIVCCTIAESGLEAIGRTEFICAKTLPCFAPRVFVGHSSEGSACVFGQ